MKKIFLLLLVSLSSFAQQYQSIDHPRLLLTNQELELVKKNIAEDQYWKNIHVQLIEEADNILPLPTLERIQIGRKLLNKYRDIIRKILFFVCVFCVNHMYFPIYRVLYSLLSISYTVP